MCSSGYLAMARYITNAGALCAYVARGLGRPVGIGAAPVAAIAYNLLQDPGVSEHPARGGQIVTVTPAPVSRARRWTRSAAAASSTAWPVDL